MQESSYHILPSTTLYLPSTPENNFASESDKNWQAAREYKNSLDNESPTEQAHRYYAKYPNYPPDRFYTSTRQRKGKARHALRPAGWATRLFDQLGHSTTPAYFYSLHMTHLGLTVDYADPRFMYYPLVIQEIKATIAAHVPAPYFWKLEVGRDHALHVHLIAARPLDRLAHLVFDSSKVIQPIRPGTEVQLLAYLSKPTAPWTSANYANYLEAKATKQTAQLPRLSGQIGIKKARQGTAV